MKSSFIKIISGFFILALAGCSPVKFYSGSDPSVQPGFRYYTVKPFLQVERDLSSNSITKATVLYLPDIEHPQFISIKDGLGSRKLDLKVTDGTLTTIGSETDPLIAETLTAAGNLASKTAEAIKDLSGLKSVPTLTGSSSVTELYDIIMDDGVTTLKKIEIH